MDPSYRLNSQRFCDQALISWGPIHGDEAFASFDSLVLQRMTFSLKQFEPFLRRDMFPIRERARAAQLHHLGNLKAMAIAIPMMSTVCMAE